MNFIKNLFAAIYETWFQIYDSSFTLIFATLYEDGGYIKLGLTFFMIPLILWLLFYKGWQYPYGKIWHWLVWLFVNILIVAIVTWSIANSEIFASNNLALADALADPESGYEQYANTLPMQFVLVNCLLSLILSFAYSLFLKRFSKIQIHLPF